MAPEDWAAWAGVQAIVEGVTRAGTDPETVAAYVLSDALALDLYKGVRGNFRAWDGQLRQPILLATHNAVIANAPLDGFEHQTNTLDTLGADRLRALADAEATLRTASDVGSAWAICCCVANDTISVRPLWARSGPCSANRCLISPPAECPFP